MTDYCDANTIILATAEQEGGAMSALLLHTFTDSGGIEYVVAGNFVSEDRGRYNPVHYHWDSARRFGEVFEAVDYWKQDVLGEMGVVNGRATRRTYAKKTVITSQKESWCFTDALDDEVIKLCRDTALFIARDGMEVPSGDEFSELVYECSDVGMMRDAVIECAQDVLDCELVFDY